MKIENGLLLPFAEPHVPRNQPVWLEALLEYLGDHRVVPGDLGFQFLLAVRGSPGPLEDGAVALSHPLAHARPAHPALTIATNPASLPHGASRTARRPSAVNPRLLSVFNPIRARRRLATPVHAHPIHAVRIHSATTKRRTRPARTTAIHIRLAERGLKKKILTMHRHARREVAHLPISAARDSIDAIHALARKTHARTRFRACKPIGKSLVYNLPLLANIKTTLLPIVVDIARIINVHHLPFHITIQAMTITAHLRFNRSNRDRRFALSIHAFNLPTSRIRLDRALRRIHAFRLHHIAAR